jgi:hypothetical protein
MKPRLALAPCLAVLLPALGTASASPSAPAPARFQVLAHVNPGIVYAADVWVHRGHAYLSSHKGRQDCPADGVLAYDLRNPRKPRLVSRFARVAGTWTEKTIVRSVRTPAFTGDVAVTSFQACNRSSFRGFGLYDVTNPRTPRRLALVRTEPRGSHEIWLAPVGRKAYVYTAIVASEYLSAPDFDPDTRSARMPGRPDFRIYDVSEPRRPREVGAWGAWRELGIHPSNGLAGDPQNLVHSVITNQAATRAYLSYWDLGTVILDVSDPARPRYLGRTAFAPGEPGNAHSTAVGRGETLLLETHETSGGDVSLHDVSDPRRPVRLSVFSLPSDVVAEGFGDANRSGLADSVHDPELAGTVAYFSWYRQGVVAADVSDPAHPRFLARFLPPPALDREALFCPGERCRAMWGVALGPGYVVASDMLGGLWVLKLIRPA